MKRKQKSPRPKKPVLSQALRESFLHFLEYHPPRRVNRNLRKVLAELLNSENASVRSKDIKTDLEGLLALLDVAEIESVE